MELPEQLRANRERLGLSQEDVAHKIYVSRQTISSWENGKTYPDVQSLLLLSQLFGVSIDELVKGDVVSMKDRVKKDSLTLKRLGNAIAGFLLAALACGGLAIILRDVGPMTEDDVSVGCVIALLFAGLFFLAGFAAAVWAEVLKHQYDVVALREITAFTEGLSPDEARNDSALSRKHPVLAIALKFLCGLMIGLVTVMLFTIVAKYIRDFVFLA